MHSATLVLDRLTKTYGAAAAVDRLSLTVPSGELLALLGPSGCGKTTCLRMIAGLVEPSAGDIRLDGTSIAGLPVHRRNTGMLFQSYALFPHLTVAGNLAFGLEMRRMRKAEIRQRVAAVLQMVRMEDFADRSPQSLSGGQQQRAALARALVIEPSILLLDEPFGALDKSLRDTMQIELRQLQRRLHVTTVMVTHDQEEALTLADRIAVMNQGRLEQVGTPAEIYRRPATRFVAGFIGTSNFLAGTVLGRQGDAVAIGLEDGRLLASPPEPEGSWPSPGSTLTVAVRPEMVRVLRAAVASEQPANSLPCVIEEVIYRGAVTQFHMRRAHGERLVAYHRNDERSDVPELLPGTRVSAVWEDSANWMVRDTAAVQA